mmetsp:Transcript_902/g.785  ORF Transcript_902/g.785 Transcript_902/m.785 type:complete len:208 (-) Transcript_902:864-1487(-)
MSPEEFSFDEEDSNKSEFVHLIYQIMNFLHKRNFNAVTYLRSLKHKIETHTVNTDEKLEVVRLIILISFLLKDNQDSLIFQELDFKPGQESSIKPNFLKNLLNTLNLTLGQLDYFNDESIFDCEENSKSFAPSNAEIIGMRKSIFSGVSMTPEKLIEDDELEESPFERADSHQNSSIIYEDEDDENQEIFDENEDHFLDTRRSLHQT